MFAWILGRKRIQSLRLGAMRRHVARVGFLNSAAKNYTLDRTLQVWLIASSSRNVIGWQRILITDEADIADDEMVHPFIRFIRFIIRCQRISLRSHSEKLESLLNNQKK
jgi:hypothetical protein